MQVLETIPSVGAVAYQDDGHCSLNITNFCTLRCQSCPKHQAMSHPLRLQREPSAEEIINILEQKTDCRYMAFHGLGEATSRLDILLPVARYLKERGSYIHLYTNGLANLYHGRSIVDELAQYIDEVSVEMFAPTAVDYERQCRPKQQFAFEYMLNFVQAARKRIAEVNVRALRQMSESDLDGMSSLAQNLGVSLIMDDYYCSSL